MTTYSYELIEAQYMIDNSLEVRRAKSKNSKHYRRMETRVANLIDFGKSTGYCYFVANLVELIEKDTYVKINEFIDALVCKFRITEGSRAYKFDIEALEKDRQFLDRCFNV